MRLRFDFTKLTSNHHGPKRHGKYQTIKGWKVKFLDIREENAWNKEMSRAVIYWRFILYWPSGACRFFDVILSHGADWKPKDVKHGK